MKKCRTVVKNRGFHVWPFECSSTASLVLSKCSLKTFSASIGGSWGALWPNLDALDHLLDATWSLLDTSWSQLGASWTPLGASWATLGSSWTSLGVNLGSLGRLLEPTWTLLGPTWPILGASWTQLGASWGPLGFTWLFQLASQRHLDSIWPPSTSQCHCAAATAFIAN